MTELIIKLVKVDGDEEMAASSAEASQIEKKSEESKVRPGPVSSKLNTGAVRRGSTTSVSSIKSNAVAATETSRKEKRELSLRAKRYMNRSKSAYESNLDDTELEEDKASASGEASTESNKEGRPPTTGEYIGLAEAKRKLVEAQEKELELQKERELRALTSEELFDKMGLDIGEAVKDARRKPTADLSNRARKLQKKVLQVARVSKNLQGGMQRELKQAALFTSAFVEVLRTRVEEGPETDGKVQIEGLRKELVEAKRANQRALEEIERLKKELGTTEVTEEKKRRVRKRAQVLSSSSSEEDGTDAQRKKKKYGSGSSRKSPSKNGDDAARKNWEDTDVEMAQGASLPVPSAEVTERAISKGVLPPREEWPPAIRPQIQGKIKILEDRDLSGHKVHIREKLSPSGKNPEKEKTAPEASLFERLVPMLDKWIESRLGPLLPTIKSGQGKKKEGATPAAKGAGKSSTKARSGEVAPAKTIPNTGETKGEDHTAWTQVLGRKQKVAAKKQQQHQEKKENQAASTALATKTGARKNTSSRKTDSSKKMSGEPKPARKRPPRTAAVTLSCPSGKYAEALSKAKEEINLEELGIKNLRPRKGVTGALVLEIAGADGTNKAKQLKERMQEALKNMEGVRVARPVKCVDLRIKDVLESTSEVEIRKAIAAHGEGMEEDIRVGAPQHSLNGLYTVWARCPVALANKITSQGRLQIGWFSARVETLAARPLSCFKCLELGHVQANCRSSEDRRNLCYRCGQPGHLARSCGELPNCPVCAQAGKPASHRVGAPACTRSPKDGGKKEKATRSAVRGGPPPLVERDDPVPVRSSKEQKGEEPMEVEQQPPPKEQRKSRNPGREDPEGKSPPSLPKEC